MNRRPDFIDNQNGNTLAAALGAALGAPVPGAAAEPDEAPDAVSIATAFFSPTGFAQIADHLKPVPSVRLLLGADPAATAVDERKRLDETPQTFEHRRMQAGLRRMDDTLHRERDRLPFTRTSAHALNKLIAALRAGNLEVRRYEEAFLHAKAYIITPTDGAYGKPEAVIVGSSNLTGAGLTRNLELNLGRYDRPVVTQAREWFDELWDEAVPYDLAVVFEAAFQPRTPWEIFIRVLWHLYGDEVEEDSEADENLPLTSFQKHGVARALRLIREMGGVIVADEVGLGKTFVAGRNSAALSCAAATRSPDLPGRASRQHLEALPQHLPAVRRVPVLRAACERCPTP